MSKVFSTRTFGVEFELFFTKENAKKFVQDNLKFILDEKNIKKQWEREEKHEPDGISWKEFLKEHIQDMSNEPYQLYDYVQDVLEQRLKLDGWNIHDDGSISGGAVSMEIVTPTLQGNDGIKQIKKFLNYFNKFASVNQTCGLHVHIGANDFLKAKDQTDMLAASLLYYSTFENIFDSLVVNSRRKSKSTFAKSPDIQDVLHKINLGFEGFHIQPNRYRKVNLCSLGKHKTIEFRHMHGVLDPTVVVNWVKICAAFVDTVKENYTSFKPVFTRKSVPQEEIDKAHARFINGVKKTKSVSSRFAYAISDDVINDILENSTFIVNKSKYYVRFKTRTNNKMLVADSVYALRRAMNVFNYNDYESRFIISSASFLKDNTYEVMIHDNKLNQAVTKLFDSKVIEPQMEQIKKKVMTKSGYPKHIPKALFNKVKKANQVIFKDKMAA